MPAPKKHASTRARRNKAAGATSLRALGEDEVREIPAPPAGVDWVEETLGYWERMWESEMSGEWLDSDYENVRICASLYNDFVTADSATARKEAAGELRLQRKMLGLDPLSRRSLEWTIEGAEAAKDRGQHRRRTATDSKQPEAGSDPRRVLEVVS